jgi:hypothetical protein
MKNVWSHHRQGLNHDKCGYNIFILKRSKPGIYLYQPYFQVCTSIIEEDPKGQLYHARNLDFGLFLGWDNANDTWLMSERLRNIIVNVDFQQDGKTVYQVSYRSYFRVPDTIIYGGMPSFLNFTWKKIIST